MKKLLPLGLIIAAVLSLGLMGCKQNADEEKLPGTWTSTALMDTWDLSSTNTRLRSSNYTYNYTSDNTLSNFNYPTAPNSFTYTTWAVTQEKTFTGFKASASTNPADSPYGFAFCIDINESKDWTYYTLVIEDNAIKVRYKPYTGDSTTVVDWTENEAIKTSGTNEVLVYADKDSSIIININGTNVAIIRSPVLKSGYCGIIGAVTYESYTENSRISSTYTFKEFQY